MNRKLRGLDCILIAVSFACAAQPQPSHVAATAGSGPAAPSTDQVPVMDGGAGPCSLDLTVTGPDGKPAYAATVKVHIAYGFAGARRLDLQAGTNSDGKVKFTGLPARVHRPPLQFQALKGDLAGIAVYDPATECEAKHGIAMSASKAEDKQ
jgi:hypothetical protein